MNVGRLNSTFAKRKGWLAQLASASLLAMALVAPPAVAEQTIKVGVLHSLSGTMAISETTLKDTALMLIEEQNKKAACSARNWKRLLSTPHQIGPCSQRKPVDFSKSTLLSCN